MYLFEISPPFICNFFMTCIKYIVYKIGKLIECKQEEAILDDCVKVSSFQVLLLCFSYASQCMRTMRRVQTDVMLYKREAC